MRGVAEIWQVSNSRMTALRGISALNFFADWITSSSKKAFDVHRRRIAACGEEPSALTGVSTT